MSQQVEIDKTVIERSDQRVGQRMRHLAQPCVRAGAVDDDKLGVTFERGHRLGKPSVIDVLARRQRLRVELEALGSKEFERILTEPKHSLTLQYTELMRTEGVNLEFTPEGIHRLAEVADQVNSRTENIGARRLATVMERLLESISFEAADKSGEKYLIDREYVDKTLTNLVLDEDLSRYIL